MSTSRSLGAVFAAAAMVFALVGGAASQQIDEQVLLNIETLRSAMPRLKVEFNPSTGLPMNVTGLATQLEPPPTASPDMQSLSAIEALRDNARRAVVDFFAAAGAGTQLFPMQTPGGQFVVQDARPDPDFAGNSIVEVQQAVDGIPVFGANSRVTVTPSADVAALSGNFADVGSIRTEPELSKEAGIAVALGARNRLFDSMTAEVKEQLLAEEGAEPPVRADLSIYNPAVLNLTAGPSVLTWKVDVGTISFFVDASNGEVVYSYRNFQSGLRRQVFDLEDGTAFPGVTSFDEVSGLLATPSPSLEAQQAFAISELVYRYYLTEFARVSFDAKDGPLVSHVRRGGLANAIWCNAPSINCPGPNVMVYGTGYTQSIDIVGHEMTHGVIAAEANLVYANESGALNEALADFFGALSSSMAGDGDWLIGEDLPGHSNSNPIRNMENPTAGGFVKGAPFSQSNKGQPDHYSDRVTSFDPICSTTTDFLNGCVHVNSGIINRALYLMSEGGSQSGVVVSGLGKAKTSRIVYRALATKLVSSSNFMQMAEASLAACSELATLGVTANADCSQVSNAFAAVGIQTSSPLADASVQVPASLTHLVFTAQQATAGAAIYSGKCTGCHGTSLLGGFGPPLKGPLFRTKWYKGSVGELYDFVSTKMPKASPGSLTQDEYLQLVTFIVRANGATAGADPMPLDAALLASMGFEQPPLN